MNAAIPRYMVFQMAGGGVDLPSVAALPDVDTDAASLLESAEDLYRASRGLRTGAENATSTWGNLPAVYTASGTEPLYSQYQPIVTHADAVATALSSAADALTEFAMRVGSLKIERQELVSRIGGVRGQYYDSEPDSFDRIFATNQAMQLQSEISAFAARVQLAEQTCADALAGIGGGTVTGVAATAASASGSYAGALEAAVSTSTMEQLEALAQMSPEQARAWIDAHPEFVEALSVSPPAPERVSVWWATLGAPLTGRDGTKDPNALQLALIDAMPEVLGNLNGVPYWARNDANVIVLHRELEETRSEMEAWLTSTTGAHPDEDYGTLHERYNALLAIMNAMNDTRSGYGSSFYQLVELHMDQNPPLAAISSGDLDQATNVSFIVPGMNTTVESGMQGLVNNADSLYAAQLKQLAEGESTAIVSWIGYDTPGFFTVFGNEHAQNGADRLAESIAGYNGTDSQGAHLNLIMHSYGSTTGTWALHEHHLHVDDAVILNSPGVIVDSADDINAGHVWAATPPDDYVVEIGNLSWEHPAVPKDPGFGADWYEVPDTPGGTIGAHDLGHHFLDGDNEPYGSGSDGPGEALQQLVNITLGNDDAVVPSDPEAWQEQHDQYIPQIPAGPGYY